MTDTPGTAPASRPDRGPGMTHTRRQATMTHELLIGRLASITTAPTRSSLQDRSDTPQLPNPSPALTGAHLKPPSFKTRSKTIKRTLMAAVADLHNVAGWAGL